MVASGSSRIGMPLRMGYTRLHSLHFRLSSPRNTKGLRHTGQARISSKSGEIIMDIILAAQVNGRRRKDDESSRAAPVFVHRVEQAGTRSEDGGHSVHAEFQL